MLTGAQGGHSAPIRVVYCVLYHDSLSGRTHWPRCCLTPWQSEYDEHWMKLATAKSMAYLSSESMVAATLPWDCLLCRNRHEFFAFWQ